jgi:ubiquitin-like-conjugating enzyme ATG10
VSLASKQDDIAEPFETLHKFEGEDDDALAVVKSETESFLLCDLVHSASYQVPVLYFQVCNTLWHSPPSLDTLHSILVPDLHRIHVQNVGILGAISKSDHPVTGIPLFFVHPCQTLAAMTSLQISQSGEPDDYLLGWIGIMGAAVGLSVPVQMVSRSIDRRHSRTGC